MDDDGVQVALAVVGGAGERRSREIGEAGLDAARVFVDVEEPVGALERDVDVFARAVDGDRRVAAGYDGAEQLV